MPARSHSAAQFFLGVILSENRYPLFGITPESSTADVEPLDEGLVAPFVGLLQIVEQRTALRNHLEKPAARMVVLAVRLEVFGQVVDALGEDRNLHFGRSGIAGFGGVGLDDLRLAFSGNRHRVPFQFCAGAAVSPARLNTRLGISSPPSMSASAKRRPATVT